MLLCRSRNSSVTLQNILSLRGFYQGKKKKRNNHRNMLGPAPFSGFRLDYISVIAGPVLSIITWPFSTRYVEVLGDQFHYFPHI